MTSKKIKSGWGYAIFEFCIYAILFLVPLTFSTYFYMSFEIPKTFIFRGLLYVALVTFLIKIFIDRGLRVPGIFREKWFRIFLVLVPLVMIIATVFSIEPWVSFWGSYIRQAGLFSYLHYALFFLLLIFGLRKEQFRKAFVGGGIALGIVLAYGIVQKFGFYLGGFNIDSFLGRVFSSFGHPNYFASFVLICFFPLLAFAVNAWRKRKWLSFGISGFLLVLSLANLEFTKGRASGIGLFAGGVVFLILAGILFGRKKLVWAAMIPVIVLGLAVGGANIFRDVSFVRDNSLTGRLILEGENLRSIETRLIMWPSVFKMALDRPLFGHGPETFTQGYGPYMQKELMLVENFQDVPDRAHNIVLQWISDYGFVGFFVIFSAFVWMILFVVRRIRAMTLSGVFRLSDGVFGIGAFCSIIGIFVAHQFGFSTTEHFVFVTFLIASTFVFMGDGEVEKVRIINFESSWQKWVAIFLCAPALALFGYNLTFAYSDVLFVDAYRGVSDGEFYKSLETAVTADAINPFQNYYKYFIGSTYLGLSKEVKDDPNFREKVLDAGFRFASASDKFASGNDALNHMLLGLLYAEKEDDASSAEKEFSAALKLMPLYPNLLLEVGKFYLENGKFDEAIKTLEFYLSLAPKDWHYKLNPVGPDIDPVAYNKYRLFCKANPTFSEVFVYLSRAYSAVENKEKAEYYEKLE